MYLTYEIIFIVQCTVEVLLYLNARTEGKLLSILPGNLHLEHPDSG